MTLDTFWLDPCTHWHTYNAFTDCAIFSLASITKAPHMHGEFHTLHFDLTVYLAVFTICLGGSEEVQLLHKTHLYGIPMFDHAFWRNIKDT